MKQSLEQTLFSLEEDEQSLSLKEGIKIKSSITEVKESLYRLQESITLTNAAIKSKMLVIDEVEASETEIVAEAVIRHYVGVKDLN